MSFQPYHLYKPSGNEWLGDVPAHWEIRRLRHFASFSGGGTPSRDNPAFWNGNIPWVSPKDMKSEVISDTEESITQGALEGSAASLRPPGELLMVVRSGILKHTIPVATNSVPVALNQDMRALRFDPDVCAPEFMLRWVQGLNDHLLLEWCKQGATVESVEHSYLVETPVPLPPMDEQIGIIHFLERETAKIDALVNEQQRLVELLKEKRQALVTQAVTKGLNPSAPMKPSVIEWIGDIPAHWEVVPLKWYWSVTDCKHITAEFVDEGVPLASIREVQGRFVNLSEAKQTTESYYEMLIEGNRRPLSGDLIFSRNATVGEVAQVCDLHSHFAMGQDVCLLRRIDERSSPDFMQLMIRSPVVTQQLDVLMVGSTFKRVNVEEIRNLRVLWPPVHEQELIASNLLNALHAIDELEAECSSAIGLLTERRASLISAAVTGKIDVRVQSRELETA